MTHQEGIEAARVAFQMFLAKVKVLSEDHKAKVAELRKESDEAKLKDIRTQLGL
ncbi:MAG: hypothetical protein AAB518_02425 [Patescibacteria group bacterium]